MGNGEDKDEPLPGLEDDLPTDEDDEPPSDLGGTSALKPNLTYRRLKTRRRAKG